MQRRFGHNVVKARKGQFPGLLTRGFSWLSGAFQTCQVTLSAQTTIQLQQPQLAPFLRMQQILCVMGSSQAFRSMDQWNPQWNPEISESAEISQIHSGFE